MSSITLESTNRIKNIIRSIDSKTGYKNINLASAVQSLCDGYISDSPVYSFGVLSDLHIQYETGYADLQRALTYLKDKVPFTCICGDLVSYASYENMAKYKEYITNYAGDMSVYECAGNHESYPAQGESGDIDSALWLDTTGKQLYYMFNYCDDVFIMLSMKSERVDDLFPDGGLEWLQSTLESNKDKRCFVFFHAPNIADKCADPSGTWASLMDGTSGNEFLNIIKQYKNVVWFHGHTHVTLGVEQVPISQNLGYRSVHIPSLVSPRFYDATTNSLVDYYYDSNNNKIWGSTLAEGYIVDVHENKIILRGINYAAGADKDLVEEFADEVYALNTTTKKVFSWNQCPPLVKAFLDEVTYDPADYSTSQIANYAPATADQSNTKPVGKTVGGKTFYNEIPNKETPFSTETTAGTLKPLDRLRWLNTATMNVRDLGGWACDGGTVKYGMLFRGGEPNAVDKALMVEDIGIRHELQLRGAAEAPQQYSLWGVDFTCPETFVWMSLSNKPAWKQILRCVFDTIPYNLPLYFHCAAGADRTGTVAVMLEALLGMSQSDIDKDYELTCFSTGTGTDAQARRRNEDEYKAYIAEIKAVPLPSGVEDTFRNHAIYFVASLGFTADEINAFRSAMIDGTPDVISLVLESYGITNNLSYVENSNADTAVSEYQPYTAQLKAPNGYVIDSVQVKMGGVDITPAVFKGTKTNLYYAVNKNLTGCLLDGKDAVIAGQDFVASFTADSGYTLDGATVTITMGGNDMSSYYSDGKIAIPNVTGDIEITATAVSTAPSYTNLAKTFETGRLNSSGSIDSTTTAATVCTDYIEFATGDVLRIKGFGALTNYNSAIYNSSKANVSSAKLNTQTYYGTYSYDESTEVVTFIITKENLSGLYIRFSGVLARTTADVIITKNEEI